MFSLNILLSVFFVYSSVTSVTLADEGSDVDGIGISTIVELKILDIQTSFEDFIRDSGLIQVARRSKNGNEALRYTFGTRDYSKDKIVSQGSGWQSFSMPKNIQLRLDYPSRGNGALVTFVEIDVQQSSKNGRAYILSGGTNKREIEIMVEGKATSYLKYSYKVYGIYN
ncbi:uncharacterized protein LOC129952537 [Eupeodes corollae]|uniref:uncharacterized protein LOC129952537 n=1 Tax=Eupeodes corollae TaxID=290404 RepID=UPI00249036A5|nr:uncharacterized protein LOC129952537 [Eupeodes corollae]